MKHVVGVKTVSSQVPEPANDSRELWDRLAALAEQGAEAPETLTFMEIKQVCFVLAMLLSEMATKQQ